MQSAESFNQDMYDNNEFNPDSLFIEACTKGYLDEIEVLLMCSRLNPQANNNEAIRMAIENNHVKVVEYLFQTVDFDYDKFEYEQRMSLLAVESGNLAIVELVFTHASLLFENDGETLVQAICNKELRSVMPKLISVYGYDCNENHMNTEEALRIIIEDNDIEMTKWFFEHNAFDTYIERFKDDRYPKSYESDLIAMLYKSRNIEIISLFTNHPKLINRGYDYQGVLKRAHDYAKDRDDYNYLEVHNPANRGVFFAYLGSKDNQSMLSLLPPEIYSEITHKSCLLNLQ
jgi:hypothetical protein